MWVRPAAYPREEHLKGDSLRLTANIRQGWNGLPGTNANLLQKFVNYCRKKVYNIGPWWGGTLDCLAKATVIKKKKIITLTPGQLKSQSG